MHRRIIACLAAVLMLSGLSHASTIIDQQSSSFDAAGTRTTAGQSFTPTLNGIDFATFHLVANNVNTSVFLNLYEGSGYGGALIATTSAQTIAASAFNAIYSFNFASTVTLIPNAVYTLQLQASGPGIIVYRDSQGNPYGGGTSFYNGNPVPIEDLQFSEGIYAAATPEPSSFVLLGTGLLGMVGAVRRRFA